MDPTHQPLPSGRAVMLRLAAGITMISLSFGFLNFISALHLQDDENDPYAAMDLNPEGTDIIEFEPPAIDNVEDVDHDEIGEHDDASGAFLGEDSSTAQTA